VIQQRALRQGDHVTPMEYPRLELIAAVDKNGGVGLDNRLPWQLPSEWAYFQRMTVPAPDSGRVHAAIFGRRTWDSIPPGMRPWKNCINYIISRSMTPSDVEQYDDVHVLQHLSQVVDHLHLPEVRKRVDRVWVHGGRIAWSQALQSAHFHRLYLTKIDAAFDADVHFPDMDESLLEKVHDVDVPQGVVMDSGVAYAVHVFQTRGTSPIH